MRKLLAGLFVVLWSAAGPAAAQEQTPDQLVRTQTDRILELIRANRDEYKRDTRKLYAMVDKEVLPYFDFRAMSRSVLGRNWNNASEEQRERFVKEFRDLLVRTYATALLKYNNEEIRYLPFRHNPGDRTAVVRTEVIQSGGGPNIPINYSFFRSKDGWKVYDVAIENSSLVITYRGTYADRIRKQGLDGLIASLAEANRRGEVDETAPAPGARKK